MENAGRNAANIILDLLEHTHHLVPADARVVIFCGGGNNGGDGYVIARQLHNASVRDVTAVTTRPPAELSGDAAINALVADRMGLVHPFTSAALVREWMDNRPTPHIVVDALLGTGFHGAVRDDAAEIIDEINTAKERGATVVAVDVPSGFDCQTGRAEGSAALADVTVTFLAPKTGFADAKAEIWLGRIVVADIGAPPELIDRVLERE